MSDENENPRRAPATSAPCSDIPPLHVLLVIDSLGSGGAQRQMVLLALGLSASGHRVELFVYHPQHRHFRSALDQARITVHSHHKRFRLSPNVVVALRRVIKRGKFDAIVSFLDTPNAYAEVACAGLRERPVLVVSERSSFGGARPRLGARLLRYGHLLADHVVVNSYHHRATLAHVFPWLERKMTTITNGVAMDRFQAPHVRRRAGESLSLLAVGNIVPNKNVVGLIRALHIVNQRYPDRLRVQWVGKRIPTDAGSRTYQEACSLIESLGLGSLWTWLGERADVDLLMRECDGLVHPSFYEGTPNVICEALASGLPVLASDVCDHGLLVQDGSTGFLFDPRDPQSIASALERFMSLSEAERVQAGTRARAYAQRVLNSSRYVQEYESLLADLVGSKG